MVDLQYHTSWLEARNFGRKHANQQVCLADPCTLFSLWFSWCKNATESNNMHIKLQLCTSEIMWSLPSNTKSTTRGRCVLYISIFQDVFKKLEVDPFIPGNLEVDLPLCPTSLPTSSKYVFQVFICSSCSYLLGQKLNMKHFKCLSQNHAKLGAYMCDLKHASNNQIIYSLMTQNHI